MVTIWLAHILSERSHRLVAVRDWETGLPLAFTLSRPCLALTCVLLIAPTTA